MPANRDFADWGFMARYRMRITYLCVLVGFSAAYILGARPASLLPPNSTQAWVGLILLVDGVLLRSWACGVIRKDEQLADTGPYALWRHPLYIANSVALLGLAMLFGGWWLLLAMLPLCAVLYLPTLRNEEQAVTSMFPKDYPAYRQRVGWFGPKRLPTGVFSPWSAAQWWANREYELFVVLAVLLIVFELLAVRR